MGQLIHKLDSVPLPLVSILKSDFPTSIKLTEGTYDSRLSILGYQPLIPISKSSLFSSGRSGLLLGNG